MTRINIVFDDIYDDVDIIVIPDQIAPRIKELCQDFLLWEAPEDDSDYWITINNKKCSIAETKGFIKWLNQFHCHKLEKAHIFKEKTNYCPQYQTIKF